MALPKVAIAVPILAAMNSSENEVSNMELA
jgi:hypothetical protein